MTYRYHLFFCLNLRTDGRKSCEEGGEASELYHYTKKRIKELGLAQPGEVRVSRAGCLGRCKEGPTLVIYPEGVWYSYHSKEDIDEVIEKHILNHQIVTRLLMRSSAA
jgi:(2Fe-2S) ferredoxin